MSQDNYSSENVNTEKVKEFALSTFALKNQTTVFLLSLLLLIFGVRSYTSMPKELFPEIVFPMILVNTSYPGNAPLDIENLVTRPIEKEVKSVDGIKKLTSVSVQDFSAIVVEFNTDVDVSVALQDVKDAVDKAKKDLPNDLPSDPQITDINASEFPMMNINLYGDYSINELKKYAEILEEKIEALPEISKVNIKGLLDREILISVDLNKLEALNLNFDDIGNAIAQENTTVSSGDILMEGTRRTIRTVGEFKDVKSIEEIIVKHKDDNIVFLRDVAEVKDSYEEPKSFARLNGKPVVSLDIIKKSGENLLEATKKINLILADAQKNYFPPALNYTITNDQSEQTKSQVKNLEDSIIMGVILVVLILLFFLGLRNALFVGLAIPMSMFITFAILAMMGITMNLMVLFSLILALGMLVDNAIVVIENIYRLYNEEKYPIFKACKEGIGEIALPIISSTATTLAAFFPLLFWDEVIGKFMRYLPLTLIITLTSSLFVALIINPVVALKYTKIEDINRKYNKKKLIKHNTIIAVLATIAYAMGANLIGGFLVAAIVIYLMFELAFQPTIRWFQISFLPKLENFYKQTLDVALKANRPLLIIVGMFLLLIFSIVLVGIRGNNIEFFPVNEPKYINIFIEMPIGTDIQETNKLTLQIEEQVNQLLKPYMPAVRSIIANVGENSNDPNKGTAIGTTPHKARITITFKEYDKRQGISSAEVMKLLSQNVKDIPGVIITIGKDNAGPPVGKDIEIEITGDDLNQLINIADTINLLVDEANIKGIEDLRMNLDLGKPEMLLEIDRTAARRFGISTGQIAMTIRTALFGKEVSKYKEDENEYPINVKLADKFRYDVAALMNQKITFQNQQGKIIQIPISSVATFKYDASIGAVNRNDMKRSVKLMSNAIAGYNSTKINLEIKKLLERKLKLPEGYVYKFAGKDEEQAKSAAFLGNALLIAVGLIALILVGQFNSISKPVIILTSVLFSLNGVFLGLGITGQDFVIIMTGIGIVSLAGVVVNNAIVLIDYTVILENRKKASMGVSEKFLLPLDEEKEIITTAGKTRLRPVLLTAITTVLGLLPLATGMNFDFVGLLTKFNPHIYFGGDNANFWGPMAWTVVYGLTFATFLTLVVVPAMYLQIHKLKLRLRKKKAH